MPKYLPWLAFLPFIGTCMPGIIAWRYPGFFERYGPFFTVLYTTLVIMGHYEISRLLISRC